ncbi:hypothetical protein [Methylobacterium haplocladii]|uniref:HTH cro/C1-type domain-containing protein n=1 Tax=Methylobacterium haplocladii TaxID=1176176 RepID=A0A512ISH0_9HYPH|nr:hypothetical protein [Methylobacterium haplocladii]GEP00631.1 hypothetical protein MHA02_30180 [Methylobacterium haplocladii]GJD85547.1 hypothetical protein HPGCJGGD_3436 [Methylobacterium haplocladii]GLS57779.1 hypothetical protein GCM10007887_04350 [Methylobacterium haplocladii]
MSDRDMIRAGDPIPSIGAVEVGNGPYDVLITWADGHRAGQQILIDLAPVILTYKVFIPLRDDRRLFATVRVAEYGEAIEWGDNDDLAVAGTTLERLANETMTNVDFAAFLKRNRLTLDAAAGQLGIGRRQVSYYAKGREIPRYISLACKYIEERKAVDDINNYLSAGNTLTKIGLHNCVITDGNNNFDCVAQATAAWDSNVVIIKDGGVIEGYYVPPGEKPEVIVKGGTIKVGSGNVTGTRRAKLNLDKIR